MVHNHKYSGIESTQGVRDDERWQYSSVFVHCGLLHVRIKILLLQVHRQIILEDREYFERMLKGPKREKLHAMHVKELIKTNYFER